MRVFNVEGGGGAAILVKQYYSTCADWIWDSYSQDIMSKEDTQLTGGGFSTLVMAGHL